MNPAFQNKHQTSKQNLNLFQQHREAIENTGEM